MTTKAVAKHLPEEARRALITQTEHEDGPSGILRPPRYKLVSTSQAFQQTLTEEIVKEVPGTIIAARIVRALWGEREVASDAGQAPICTSTNGSVGLCQDTDAFVTIAEDKGFGNDVAPFQPMPCVTCPFNEWGSGKNTRGKACKEMRRLLIMPDHSQIPAILSVPPSSVANWDNYWSGLKSLGEAYFSVQTIIGAEKATNPEGIVYSKVIFRNGGPLPEETLRQVLSIRKEYESLIGQQVEAEEYQAEG